MIIGFGDNHGKGRDEDVNELPIHVVDYEECEFLEVHIESEV